MKQTDKTHPDSINAVHTKPFAQMTGVEKLKHIGKVILFVLSFGFAFPTLFSD